MKKLAWILGLVVPLAAAAGLLAWLARPALRPNVLLVTIDTLRADHLGCYGHARATSPNIDAIAAAGVRFDGAFTSSTLSGPSHASMLTSLPVPTHLAFNNTVTLEDRFLTLPELLQQSGYETGCFVSHEFVSAEYGLAQGCDVAELHHVPSHLPGHAGHEDHDETAAPLDGVFVAAARWLARERERPFFLWLHAQHPHVSYEPPAPFDEAFGAAPETSHDLRCRDTLLEHRKRNITLTDEEKAHVVALYDGEIAFVDAELGRIFDQLRADGTLQNTIVVVTADHGEMLFDDAEQLRTGHGRERREPVLRVPFVMSGPGLPRGVAREPLVGTIDLAPTVLELLGSPPPSAWRGQSLMPTVRDAEPVRTQLAAAALHTDSVWRLALRVPDAVLHCDVSNRNGATYCLAYDLAEDPGQTRRAVLGQDSPPELLDLHRSLSLWYDSAREHGRSAEFTQDERAREMLRRGGYLDDEEETGEDGP